jgi:hypothetical protein
MGKTHRTLARVMGLSDVWRAFTSDIPMHTRIFPFLAPVLAGGLLLPVAAVAQATGTCGQTAALTESLDAALSPGFDPVRRFVQIRRTEARYVEFALDAPEDVTLRTEAPTIDPAIALYDQSGQLVGWDDDGGGGTNALVAQSLRAGRYCVQVRPIGASPVDFAEVVLIIEPGIVAAPGQEAPCSTAATQDLALGLTAPVDPIAVDDATDPEIGRRDYNLSLAEPLGLRIELASGEFDTVLEVFDASGETVASNDDFSGTDSRVEQVFPAGNYCVVARSFGDAGGSFSMAVSEADIAPPAMPCGDPARTEALTSGFGPGGAPARVQGTIPADLLQSWYALNVSAPVDLQLDARSLSLDTVLEVYDSAGALVAENDDGPDGTNSRIEATLFPGDYCVTVRGYDDGVGAFDLSLVPAGMSPPDTAVGAPDPATAGDVEEMGILGDVVRSFTIGGDATLWTSFVLEGGAAVTVTGMSISSDFSIALFAEDGTPLGETGPVAAMSPAELSADLPAGTFLVALTNHGGMGTLLRQVTVTRN